MKENKSIIISTTSDIGKELAYDWQKKGDSVVGTYRTENDNFKNLKNKEIDLQYLDLLDKSSIQNSMKYICKNYNNWDKLVICPATQDPIGRFEKINFDDWEESIILNFTSQMRILHNLLPYRNKQTMPSVIFFAGGGTNGATVNYSAYTISKIASIKFTELLDAEIDDVKFIIYGPGWVKTKIHQSTLNNPFSSEDNYQTTIDKLNSNECTPMKDIIDSINWGIDSEKDIIGGRNISVVFDKWGTKKLEEALAENKSMYKLRRSGNDWGK